MRYAKTAIDVGFLVAMEIEHSDFDFDDVAIEVLTTFDNEPALAALPCVPPYLSFIVSVDNWYGVSPVPPPDFDLHPYLTPGIPAKYADLFTAFLQQASKDAPHLAALDTVPWELYECPIVGIPAVPLTPVLAVGPPPLEPNFSGSELE